MNKRMAYSTGIIINKNEWDNYNQRVNLKSNTAFETNNKLNTIYGQILSEYSLIMSKRGYVMHEDIMRSVFSKEKQRFDLIEKENPILIDLIKRYQTDLKERFESKLIAYGSYRSYMHSIKIFTSFLNLYYTSNFFRLKDASKQFFSEFEAFLLRQRHLSNNTTNKTTRHILSILNLAFNNGWIEQKPYIVINTKYKNPKREILTLEEVRRIQEINLPSKWDNEARDVALFQIYTGLAYSEVRNLKQYHIKDLYGKKWIIISRKKTGNESKVVLLPIPLTILNKYENHEFCIKMNQLLPITANHKYNSRLKIIQRACNISTKISSHILRHTFSTTIALSLGLSMESLSKVLGHSSLKTTAIYGKIMDRRILEEFEALERRL